MDCPCDICAEAYLSGEDAPKLHYRTDGVSRLEPNIDGVTGLECEYCDNQASYGVSHIYAEADGYVHRAERRYYCDEHAARYL